MTDQELQDLLDRLDADGGAAATPGADVPDKTQRDLHAYRMVYAALEDEPDGTLPPDFAERVADRVIPAPATERLPWLETILPPLALVAAFVATLLLMPTVSQAGANALQLLLEPLAALNDTVRLDIALVAGTALLVISFVDRFVLHPWAQRGAATT